MNIVKLRQDFYRVTAYVIATITRPDTVFTIYDGEISTRMQPDISIRPMPPLEVFYRNWEKGQPVGQIAGYADLLKSFHAAVVANMKRVHRTKLTAETEINLDIEILSIQEQEEFDMAGLHPDYQNGVIRFFLQRGK